MMRVLLFFLAGCLLVATFLPKIPKDHWWIRILDFPRLQIFGLTAIVFGFSLLLAISHATPVNLGVTVVLFGLLGYQFSIIYPYTFLASQQVLEATRDDPSQEVSVLIANVLMSNRQSQKLLELVSEYNPDILLLLEPDHWWEQQLRELETDYPHTLKYPLENSCGMLLYSTLELNNPHIRFLVQDDVPSMHACVKLKSGATFDLHCMHPRPPRPFKTQDSTWRDVELILLAKVLQKQRSSDIPVIVAGDLNDVGWSYTTRLFQTLSGLLDPRIGRGLYATFHAEYVFLRWPLDHLFHSDHFRLIRLKRLPYYGSDHFPIYVHLSYEPRLQERQQAPPVSPTAKEQARRELDGEI